MIVKFTDEKNRQDFLRRAEVECAEVVPCLRPLQNRPTVVASNLTASQREWVTRNVGSEARIYDDIQFEPFAPKT